MKYVISIVVSLLVGLGLGFAIPHGANVSQKVGGAVQINETFPYGFYAGLTRQFQVTSAGAISSSGAITTTGALTGAAVTGSTYNTATIGSSSSSPAALGSAAAGHFVIAAGSTTASASTTAITANSTVSMTLEKETPIAGVTCNTTVNSSSTPMQVNKIAGNGFIVTIPSAPVTNPFCIAYRITN